MRSLSDEQPAAGQARRAGGPPMNGRGGAWSFLGQQGFPAITVPAGSRREVYDRVRDPRRRTPPPIAGRRVAEGGREAARHLIGPIAAQLPVGMDIVGRPSMSRCYSDRFGLRGRDETPHAAAGFGPVKGEP